MTTRLFVNRSYYAPWTPKFLGPPDGIPEGWISTGMAIDLPDPREMRLAQAISDSSSLALVRRWSRDGGIFWQDECPGVGAKERLEIYRRSGHKGLQAANELRDCLVGWR